MKTLNNQITVHRNEIFTMDKLVQNKDGSPYIVNGSLVNPYFLVSISDTIHQNETRYLYNKWLPLNEFPRFDSEKPIDIKAFRASALSTTPKYPNGFADITSTEVIPDFGDVVAYGYINGVLVYIPLTTNGISEDLLYDYDENGLKQYKYFKRTSGNNGAWFNYECRIITTFQKEITQDWVNKDYVYSIRLVSGMKTFAYLESQCTLRAIIHLPIGSFDNEYNYCNYLYTLLVEDGWIPDKDFDWTRPLYKYTTVTTLLEPTKLSVLNDVEGIL